MASVVDHGDHKSKKEQKDGIGPDIAVDLVSDTATTSFCKGDQNTHNSKYRARSTNGWTVAPEVGKQKPPMPVMI